MASAGLRSKPMNYIEEKHFALIVMASEISFPVNTRNIMINITICTSVL